MHGYCLINYFTFLSASVPSKVRRYSPIFMFSIAMLIKVFIFAFNLNLSFQNSKFKYFEKVKKNIGKNDGF